MSAPRISALITCYNYGRYVGEAIESALAQDFPAADMEILVVDDGSTDDTRQRVAEFGDRVRYIWKPNGGQSAAVNLGYEQARGDIIALLDADDLWLSGKMRRVADAFHRNPACGLVVHKRRVWSMSDGTAKEDSDFPVLSGAFPLTAIDLLRYSPTSTSALAFRKATAQTLFPIPESLRLHADSYLEALLIFLAPVVVLNEALTKYRVHESNFFQFAQADERRVKHRLDAMEAFVHETRNWLDAERPDLKSPEVGAYLRRYDLIEQSYRFASRGAGRREFFDHLRLHRTVYGPLWTRRYRAYRWITNYVAFVLGYRRFEKLRQLHSQGGPSLTLRRYLLPAEPEGLHAR